MCKQNGRGNIFCNRKKPLTSTGNRIITNTHLFWNERKLLRKLNRRAILGIQLDDRSGKIRFGVAWRMPRGNNLLIY
ncbi:unnamed protein product [Lactuca virosa]|uniref:Uncharacterized protein n=1 Tax=Lactuca virosa TaxID=75947 RepID=A0AAU9PFJ7_9ASTR|nr:unnamed protein product [Lactuca virosa]